MRLGLRDRISRNKDNRKHSPAEKLGQHSKTRTGKKRRGRKQGDKNRVVRKQLDRKTADKKRVDKRVASSGIMLVLEEIAAAFPRSGFASSSAESINSPCIGPKS